MAKTFSTYITHMAKKKQIKRNKLFLKINLYLVKTSWFGELCFWRRFRHKARNAVLKQ